MPPMLKPSMHIDPLQRFACEAQSIQARSASEWFDCATAHTCHRRKTFRQKSRADEPLACASGLYFGLPGKIKLAWLSDGRNIFRRSIEGSSLQASHLKVLQREKIGTSYFRSSAISDLIFSNSASIFSISPGSSVWAFASFSSFCCFSCF